MPSVVRGVDPANRPDIVLGDRYGTSCSTDLVDRATTLLKSLGYTVARNKPYAGGFITEHYGRPAKGLHALQIEINRGLYMNEETFEKSDGFDALALDLSTFIQDVVEMKCGTLRQRPLAAE
jgi:N-formylglutamate amidohydrolase